ncbi:hypothetical protein QZH41_007084 [Actinostola sp. cb2023]|nr:hypothetical protein QZH41_007084 [Actinostola sp. cb2023]
MGKGIGDKLFRYIKDGRPKRIRSVLKKRKDLNIDEFVDRRKRTVLHVACLLGEHAIVKILVQYGASIEAKDSEGNTALHLALQYALQVLEGTVYDDLIKPLFKQNVTGMDELLETANDAGETPRYLFKKFKWELRKRREDRKLYEKEEELRRDETRQAKEWHEKLFFEMGHDEEDLTKFANMNEDFTQETYDEWADRITNERRHKHFVDTKQKDSEGKKTRDQQEKEASERTRLLQEEHEAYIKQISQKRRRLKMATLKSQYESRCSAVFAQNEKCRLTFSDIPWPSDGGGQEMVEMIKTWSEAEDNRKKYLRDQQIRWHPDKFLQKCGDRLEDDDRQQIISAVNELSQGINVLLESE